LLSFFFTPYSPLLHSSPVSLLTLPPPSPHHFYLTPFPLSPRRNRGHGKVPPLLREFLHNWNPSLTSPSPSNSFFPPPSFVCSLPLPRPPSSPDFLWIVRPPVCFFWAPTLAGIVLSFSPPPPSPRRLGLCAPLRYSFFSLHFSFAKPWARYTPAALSDFQPIPAWCCFSFIRGSSPLPSTPFLGISEYCHGAWICYKKPGPPLSPSLASPFFPCANFCLTTPPFLVFSPFPLSLLPPPVPPPFSNHPKMLFTSS